MKKKVVLEPVQMVWSEEVMPENHTAISIAVTPEGVVYGLGSDNRTYVWHHSLKNRGRWVLHTKE